MGIQILNVDISGVLFLGRVSFVFIAGAVTPVKMLDINRPVLDGQ